MSDIRTLMAEEFVRANYLGKPCPHCGIELVEKDMWNIFGSRGGKFYTSEGIVGAHGACFYVHEADKEWKERHPEFAPSTQRHLSQDQLQQLLSDVEIYKTLLRQWTTVWDEIEEFIVNGLTWQDINKLYELTKKEIDPATKTKVAK